MRNLSVGLVVVMCLVWAGAVWAGPTARIPQTGQVLCYNTAGGTIPCSGTGQDGEYQMGFNLPTPRFTDNGDGTIADNLTGFIWLKNADCVGDLTWQNALDFVKNLNAGKIIVPSPVGSCGDSSGARGNHQTDWRLPNIREMMSLTDFAFSSPAISNAAGIAGATPGDPFTDLQPTVYWTSTTTSSAGMTNHAWVVELTEGRIGFDDKTASHPVIVVRGGR